MSGQWTATMNLTEPQAGSDSRSAPAPSGPETAATASRGKRSSSPTASTTSRTTSSISSSPDFDAPPGTRGISLFLVPKVLPDGTRNDVRCHGIEHKLGIHASPTCTMIFGDGGGATGWLIGEENRGLVCMFTMMNNARLAVCLQGVGIAERAYQQALSYANERRQGRAPGSAGTGMSPIVEHPDVRRTLLTMKALTQAARPSAISPPPPSIAITALPIRTSAGPPTARLLLTPVAKAFSSDIGVEVASMGVQVHGGMGFVEETGAAQHLRDARILPIYEGTNGIQAIDLVTRKLPLSGVRDRARRSPRCAPPSRVS